VQARLVAELKPFTGVIVTVAVSVAPAVAVALVGVSEIVKSFAGAAVMVTVIALEVEAALTASPP
jgi:L-lactate utilization protein LutB